MAIHSILKYISFSVLCVSLFTELYKIYKNSNYHLSLWKAYVLAYQNIYNANNASVVKS